MQNLNQTILKNMIIGLPPYQEQMSIVAEVERQFSLIESMSSKMEINDLRSSRLRQAILERAFSGNLVPQDLDDEPASKLLEKIHMEKDISQGTIQT